MSQTHIFVLSSAVALLLYVLELVRRRRLREQYAWLWLLLAVGAFSVAAWPRLTVWVTQVVGSTNPLTTIAFLLLYFLILVVIQLSSRISGLTTQNKDLAQMVGILDAELRRLSNTVSGQGSSLLPVEEPQDAQRIDHRSGGLVSGFDQHRSTDPPLAEV